MFLSAALRLEFLADVKALMNEGLLSEGTVQRERRDDFRKQRIRLRNEPSDVLLLRGTAAKSERRKIIPPSQASSRRMSN
jgi:hypothetical protein